jgi:DNA/RNA-binding domain of Phe-tRNA-synthetase-like protein
MKFIHDQVVIDQYPQNFTGIIVILNFIDIDTLQKQVETLNKQIQSLISGQEIANACQKWQDIFAKMGAKPKYKSSLTAAYEFYKHNKKLYQINPVVDFYNHYSLAHMIPMGAYDLTKVEGDLHLTFAEKGIEFIPLANPNSTQLTKNDEVIYKDDKKVTCRYWNLKDSDLTKITNETKDIIFMLDMIKENADDAKQTFETIQNDFKDIFGPHLKSAGLTGYGIGTEINL